MKLRYFDVERFGSWDSMQLGDLANGLTVVYGPNGSGKTTLMQFVRAVFYGSPNPGSHRFLPMLHQGKQGGRLGVSQAGRELVVSRLWDESSEPDKVVLTAPDGSVVTSHSLKTLLGEMHEDVFESVFTVGYREAEDLGVIVREALANTEQVVAGEELAEVEAAMLKIDRAADQLDDLLRQREQMVAEIARLESQCKTPDDDLVQLRRQIAEHEENLVALRERIAALKAEIARCQATPIPMGEDAFSEQLRLLDLRITNFRGWQREVEEQLAATRHQLHQHSLRDAEPIERCSLVQVQSVRQSMTVVEKQVAALETQFATVQSLQNGARVSLQAELKELRGQVHELCAQLGQHELLDEIASLEAESGQLERVRCEIESQVTLLEKRRRGLLAAYAGNAQSGWLRYAYEQNGACHAIEHAAWLGKPAAVEAPSTNNEELIAEHDRLAELLGEQQAALADLNLRRTKLEQELHNTDLARRLEALRFDLNVVEEEIRSAKEARDVRATTRELLDELRSEYESRRHSLVLLEAGQFLTQLSAENIELRPDADCRSILLHRAGQDARTLSALSHGERDQVALCLRLALVRAYARQNTRVPLILDDVFITSDSATAGATARLLQDFAIENQVLFFTCHEHIAEMFRRLGVAVRNLPIQTVKVAQPEPVAPQPKSIVTKIVAQPREPMPLARKEPVVTAPWVSDESLVVKAFRNEIDELTDIEVESGFEPAANWIFYTELATPIDQLSGISSEQAAGLADCGVRTVEDLIAMVPNASQSQLANLGLSVDQIQVWQMQAMLSCRVPMLGRRDAELLVRSGVNSPEQLAEAHPESIYDLVAVYLATASGKRFVKPSNPFDRQTAINWVRWAAHARTLWHSRETITKRTTGQGIRSENSRGTSQQRIQNAVEAYRSRATRSRSESDSAGSSESTASGGAANNETSNGSSNGSATSSSSARSVSARSSSSRSTSRSERSSSSGSGSRSNRTRAERAGRSSRSIEREGRSERQRSVRSEKRTTRSERRSSDDSANETTEEVRTLKFYLKRDAPVEDAPSIGPRTAEHLSKVSIVTVNDLLQADSESAAGELNHRRIKPKTIREWQAQAVLVCRIPELRGHDSQILVACGITTPEALAEYHPNDLFAKVAPFVETSEGERIIRNGKKPDLEEITFWIDCAKKSRALKAA